jgi:hypothetical protein
VRRRLLRNRGNGKDGTQQSILSMGTSLDSGIYWYLLASPTATAKASATLRTYYILQSITSQGLKYINLKHHT